MSNFRTAIARVVVRTAYGLQYGTAFLVGQRLALTALHVVADRRAELPQALGPIELEFHALGQVISAKLCEGAHDGRSDWALLELFESPRTESLPLGELSELDLQAAPVRWSAYGYPRTRDNLEGMDVGGVVRTTHATVEHQSALQLQCDEAGAGIGAQVSGLSGAPVLAHGVVVGLLRFATLDEVGRSEAGTLFACPCSTIFESNVAERLRLAQGISPCPYPGLLSYQESQQHLFFGRYSEIEALLQQLRLHSLSLVLGASGSGKSSLIKAGLLPKLGLRCKVVSLQPGNDPVQALAAALGDEDCTATITRQLGDAADSKRLLLFIDQFEEAFTLAKPEGRVPFFARLEQLRKDPRCVLLLVLRMDFYADLVSSELWPIDRDAHFVVAPLRGEALRAAIEEPAATVHVRLEPRLLDRLMTDAAQEPGVLPLLQASMALLWQEQRWHRLRLQDYEKLGSPDRNPLAVAIAIHANGVLKHLTPVQEATARRVLLRLVQFGHGRPHTRQRQSLSMLRAHHESASLLADTLDALARGRLITLTAVLKAPKADEPYRPNIAQEPADTVVDIAHEALIGSWPRLAEWIRNYRTHEEVRRRLEDKAAEWVRLNRRGGLLDELELREADTWLADNAAELGCSQELTELLAHSRAELQAESAARLSEVRRLRLFVGALSVLLLATLAASVFAWRKSAEARAQRDLAHQKSRIAEDKTNLAERRTRSARASQLAAQALTHIGVRHDLALLLAAAGHELEDNSQTQGALLSALHYSPQLARILHGHQKAVTQMAYHPAGTLLATSSDDETLRLWEIETGRLLATVSIKMKLKAMAWSPDGTRLAIGGYNLVALLAFGDELQLVWRISLRLPQGKSTSLEKLGFSSDGNTLTLLLSESFSDQYFVQNIDVVSHSFASPRVRLNGPLGSRLPNDVALSTDGHFLLMGLASGFARWDLSSLAQRGLHDESPMEASAIWRRPTKPFNIVLSADGQLVAFSERPDELRLAAISKNTLLEPTAYRHGSSVYGMPAFSQDGKLLVASTTNGVDVFNISDAKLHWPLTLPRGELHGDDVVALAPSGLEFATLSPNEQDIFLWQRRQFPYARGALGQKGAIAAVVFSKSEEDVLWTGAEDGTILRWNASTAAPQGEPLRGHAAAVKSLALSDDGNILLSADAAGVIKRWNLREAQLHPQPLLTLNTSITALAFDAQQRRIAVADTQPLVQLYQLDDKGLSPTLKWQALAKDHWDPRTPDGSQVAALSFLPDGKMVAHSSPRYGTFLFGVKDGAPINHWQMTSMMEIGRDGCLLVREPETNALRLWDIAAKKFQGPSLLGKGQKWWNVRTLDGKRMAQWGDEASLIAESLQHWNLESGETLGTPLRVPGNLQSGAFSVNGRYLAIAQEARLWIFEMNSAVWEQAACRIANRNLTAVESRRYLPDLFVPKICSNLP